MKNTGGRSLVWLALAIGMAVSTTPQADSGTATKPFRLKMGVPWQTSNAFPAYVTYRDIITARHPDIRIAVVEMGGAVITEDAVVHGEVDIGNSDAPDLYMKFHGLGRYQGEPGAQMLRALWVNQHQPNTVFVVASSGITSIKQLHGKRFGLLIGSIVGDAFKEIMASNGIKPVYFEGEPGALSGAVANNRLIGYAKGGLREASIKEIALTTPVTILPVPAEMMERALAKGRGFHTAVIPAGSYTGQKQDVPTWTSASFIVGTDKLPEELVYRMIKAVFENRKQVLDAVPTWNLLDEMPKNIVEYSSIPLHPGTVRFLREQGISVPDALLPPELLHK
jgi:TRAP transporter TAXI family solute receptor